MLTILQASGVLSSAFVRAINLFIVQRVRSSGCVSMLVLPSSKPSQLCLWWESWAAHAWSAALPGLMSGRLHVLTCVLVR